MIIFESVIQNEVGLHARPAAIFVQHANAFSSNITIRKVKDSKPPINAKSILQILMLGVCQGDYIEVVIEGEDEIFAAEKLKTLIETDFAGHL